MNIHDLVEIGLGLSGALMAALMALTGWLWRHSNRLVRAESRLDATERAVDLDRGRIDSMVQQIREALVRIEDKIDRKADRP